MMKLRSLALAVSFAAALFTSHVHAQGAGQLGAGQVWGNSNAAGGRAQATDIAAVLARWGTALPVTVGGTGSGTASGARTNLGLAIGTNVEAWDSDLDCLAALSTTGVIHRTGTGTCTAAAVALADLATGTQDTVIGYFGSTAASAGAIPNCTGALVYSTSTHLFTCNASAGTGTVTEQKNTVTANNGLTQSGNCDNTSSNTSSPCNTAMNLDSAVLEVDTGLGTTVANNTMMGWGVTSCRITPKYSSRLWVEVTAVIAETATTSFTIVLHFGTGTGPSQGAASAGTAIGSTAFVNGAATMSVPAKIGGIITGLTPGTAVWIDGLVSFTAGDGSISNVGCRAHEVM